MRKLIVCFSALVVISACSSIDCPLNSRVEAVYAIGRGDTLTDTLTVTTTRLGDTGGDTVLLNKVTGVTTFSLPVSYSADSDVLVFTFLQRNQGDTIKDTVTVFKENHPHFESVDCNASYFHTVLDVKCTRNALDSITINRANIDYDTTNPNFTLYLKRLSH